MSGFYHEGSRRLQDAFDTRRLADRLESVTVRDVIDDDDRAFIEGMDMFFLATADADGRPDCSYKGGDAGFVRVIDERTIAFPAVDGNGMFRSFGNMLVNPEVGLVVRVRAREVFPNCPRYIHRMELVERSRFVPEAGTEAPVPEWKPRDWAVDVLPASDQARRASGSS